MNLRLASASIAQCAENGRNKPRGAVAMPMQKIGHMSLRNDGGFVARIQFAYLDDDGNSQLTKQSDDITLGVTKTVDPGDFGVPDGTICYMYAFVVWGTDNQAKQAYYYSKGNA